LAKPHQKTSIAPREKPIKGGRWAEAKGTTTQHNREEGLKSSYSIDSQGKTKNDEKKKFKKRKKVNQTKSQIQVEFSGGAIETTDTTSKRGKKPSLPLPKVC